MDKAVRQSMINVEMLEQRARELATPTDFDALIQAGVLEKRRGWYKILKKDELPSHAEAKIHEVRSGNGETLVKFCSPSKRLAKMLRDAGKL
jgi:hypothetical protein